MPEYPVRWITTELAVGYAPRSHDDLATIRTQGIEAIVSSGDRQALSKELSRRVAALLESDRSCRQFAMELHLVHQSDAGGLAVIGVLVDEGEYNALAAPLVEAEVTFPAIR